MIRPGGSSISTVLRTPPRLGLGAWAWARAPARITAIATIAKPRARETSGRRDMRISWELVHHEATGDVDGLAGHVGRLAGGEEADHVGHVRRLLDAAERDLLDALLEVFAGPEPHEPFARLAVDLEDHVGLHDAGADAVGPDAVGGVGQGQAPGHADHRGLGDAVDQRGLEPHLARHRGEADDVAALGLHHVPQHRLAREEDPLGVDREQTVPVRLAHVRGVHRLVDARVVHQDVDAPPLGHRAIGHGPQIGEAGDVGLERERPPPALAHLLGGALAGGPVHLGHHHVGAHAGQLQRDGAADVAARAGDDRGLPLEFHRGGLAQQQPPAMDALLRWISSRRTSSGPWTKQRRGPPGISIGPSSSFAPSPSSRLMSASRFSESKPKCSRPWWARASPAPSFSLVRAPEMFTGVPSSLWQRTKRSPNTRVSSETILNAKAFTYQSAVLRGSEAFRWMWLIR